MNALLERQIQECLGSIEALPPGLKELFQAINETYEGFETDRGSMACALDESGRELSLANEKLRQEITDRRDSERRQTKLLIEVMKANQELTHFAYVVSHDLKSPLRGMTSLVNWIIRDHTQNLNESGRDCFDQMLQRIERMYHLIDGLLEFSKIKPLPDEITPVPLKRLVTNLLNTMALPDTIKVTIEDPLPEVRGEETRLSQIFEHLLHNAIRFMDKAEGLISIGCRELDGHWEVSIADNGPGIAEKHFERIFRIFQTLERWEVSAATGIGLPIVKKAVEMHGGDIWVESELGRGATFKFTLAKNLELSISGTLEAQIAALPTPD